jgi:glycosyltransferase involved in cell wall biosynthesis
VSVVPLVGAIIPAFNAERYVRDAISSVLAQTHAAVECILVDDGSTDGTAAAAAEFGERIRIVRQENRGVAAARNRGAREARGELLAFLDADDRWLPQRLERGVAFLERGGVEAVVCATQVVDRSLQPLRVIRHDPRVTVRDLLLCRASVVSASSNLLVTRDCFDAIGGFDERLSTSADWALTFRLVERGRLAAIAEPLVQYRVHDANMSSSVEAFERDMSFAFDEVLIGPRADPELRGLRRRAYANLHRVIAGSYFVQGRHGAFLRHAVRSVMSHPSTLAYFLGMPLRRARAILTTPRAAGTPRG